MKFDMHVVCFAIVSAAGTFVAGNAQGPVQPCVALVEVSFVFDGALHLRFHVRHGLCRETAHEDVVEGVGALNEAIGVVGMSVAGRHRRDLWPVADQEQVGKIVVVLIIGDNKAFDLGCRGAHLIQ